MAATTAAEFWETLSPKDQSIISCIRAMAKDDKLFNFQFAEPFFYLLSYLDKLKEPQKQ